MTSLKKSENKLPEKYQGDYPAKLHIAMAAGRSDTQVMAEWKISRSTFYRWLKEIPELKEAHESGKVAFDAYHEDLGIQGMLKVNDIDYQFWRDLGKFRNGWKDNSLGGNNTQINIDTMNVLNQQTNEELLEYIKSQMERHPELNRIIDVE